MNSSETATAGAPIPATAFFDRSRSGFDENSPEDGEDRERRQQQAVGGPVDHAAPEDRAGEGHTRVDAASTGSRSTVNTRTIPAEHPERQQPTASGG